jgi:hypothetical protein
MTLTIVIFAFLLTAVLPFSAFAQTPARTPEPRPKTLGVERGIEYFEVAGFNLRFLRSSQTIAAMEPLGSNGFDFIPADRIDERSSDGFHHLGDIRFWIKTENGEWRKFSTAETRRDVTGIDSTGDLLKADLSSTLPADCPIKVTRSWSVRDGKLVLTFHLTNTTNRPIELGHLGIPLVFNNIITGRKLPEAHEKNSFSDPYIGLDAGYIQITRLKGNGPALIVVPEPNTPFEAYQPLREPTRPQQTSEGMFEWVIRSKALAETEWKGAEPWNPPTTEFLQPGRTRLIGLRFLLSDSIRNIEQTLIDNKRPVAVGIPGYVLSSDIEGKLFLKSPVMPKTIEIYPKGSIKPRFRWSTANRWWKLDLSSNGWGRARVIVTYADGTVQTIHYYLTKSATEAVDDLGRFLFTEQWYENPADPFKRSPSIIGYDREANKILEQDHRVWIAGLGDEGGGGSWVAAAMKQFVRPDAGEIEKLERFIDGVLWGGLQYKDGSNKYGVRKSMLYYAPDELPNVPYDKAKNWSTWASWKKDQAMSIGRGYNYPHVVAAYWSMYRNARNLEGFVKAHTWDWYLDQAYNTTKFAFSRKPDGKYVVGYVELGLMEGTIFLELLKDLKREGWSDKAAEVERLMKERADAWAKEEYPFGSEMAWDSTGQEEVYAWCKYFGYNEKALVSLNSIIGYMPGIPHWGYNGNARRYWDFLYAAKLQRIERQIHHYGSGLNAIPMLDHYRSNPDDIYALRIGYAGGNAALTNIDREGFASAAFHSYPDTLKWDAYSGDYGMNFFGHAMNAATYVINHKEFGWQAFGGNIRENGNRVTVTPVDPMRQRLFIAPFRLWLTLDAGRFRSAEIDTKRKVVRLNFEPATANVGIARLHVEDPSGTGLVFKPKQKLKFEREAYSIPLSKNGESVDLIP